MVCMYGNVYSINLKQKSYKLIVSHSDGFPVVSVLVVVCVCMFLGACNVSLYVHGVVYDEFDI